MNNEIKFCEGIYISKGKDSKQFTDDGKVIVFPEEEVKNIKDNDSNKNKLFNTDKKSPYIYKNTGELIQILECEFIEYQEEVCLLKKANDDMLKFDPIDYDLIQARDDNLQIINKRINQLRELQLKLKEFCPTHPFVIKDIFEIISLIESASGNPEQVIYQILNHQGDKTSEIDDLAESLQNLDRDNSHDINNTNTLNTASHINNINADNKNNNPEIIKEIEL